MRIQLSASLFFLLLSAHFSSRTSSAADEPRKPEARRVNPVVLPIAEIRADFVWAKILAYDLREEKNGEMKIGVIKIDTNKDLDKEEEIDRHASVEYVPLAVDRLEGRRLALTIYPQRLLVIQAAFPFKAQLKEIQKALRIEKFQDVLGLVERERPIFRGFVIQRRNCNLDGTVMRDWYDLDVESAYRKSIFGRMVATADEPVGLDRAMLSPENQLVMPLPFLISGKYPEVKLQSIEAAIRTNEKNKGDKSGKEPPETILVRIVDNDLVPGQNYQYRIKLRLSNPNWVGAPVDGAKYRLVDKRTDADIEIIEGPFVEMKETVSVPREFWMLAADSAFDEDARETRFQMPRVEQGQALIRVQRWLPFVTVGAYEEPIGDWIVADVVARRGTYLGGKQWVNVPLWVPETNRFRFQKIVRNENSKAKDPKRGVWIDLTQPGPVYTVVDVQGGQQEWMIGGRMTNDETAREVLLMEDDGKLQVRSSFVDRGQLDFRRRTDEWRSWLERTENATRDFFPPKK